jgi:hypothetical protein
LKKLAKIRDMETHKIDSVIKKAINESENYYDSEANIAKERIWNHIQLQKQNQSKPALLRLFVAASILLFISLSIVTISNIRNRGTLNTLVELNSKLENEAKIRNRNTLKRETIAASHLNIPDTIFIEKKVIQYKPIITTKQITDTVYIQQLVYIEKQQEPALVRLNENNSSADSMLRTIENTYKSEILISSKESLKSEKRKKIQIIFGSTKGQVNSGTLAITTNL